MGATNPNAGGAPGGGGKGGMGMNRGPGGNAQNNPGGPQANFGMDQITWGGRGAPYNGPMDITGNSVSQMPAGNPMAKFQSMMSQQIPWGSPPPKPFSFDGWNRPEMGGGNLTPINQAIPTPQPQEPIGGYINGQPAQFHHQAQALNNPQPQKTASGLPAGGLLARLYGG